MNVAETILVFVGAPLAIFLLLAALIFLPGGRKRPRYRPGQPWDHAPVWYEPHPEHSPAAGHAGGETLAIGSSLYGEQHGDGAEHGHGSTAAAQHDGAAAPSAVSAGPLGGARGTW